MAIISPVEQLALFAAKKSTSENIDEFTRTLVSRYFRAIEIVEEYEKQNKKDKKESKIAAKLEARKARKMLKKKAKGKAMSEKFLDQEGSFPVAH